MKIILEKGINKGWILRLEGKEIGITDGACILETWEEVLEDIDKIYKSFYTEGA